MVTGTTENPNMVTASEDLVSMGNTQVNDSIRLTMICWNRHTNGPTEGQRKINLSLGNLERLSRVMVWKAEFEAGSE